MLLYLKVKDFALIGGTEVEFGEGLNLLTGETGSGKSLLIDALSLTLGTRASNDQIRSGAEGARVEAVFSLTNPKIPAMMDLETEGQIILIRDIGKRAMARINGTSSTPSQLKEIGKGLVAIHGQHEQQDLLDRSKQTDLLDLFAGNDQERDQVLQTYLQWQNRQSEYTELEQLQAKGKREEEFMRWQLKELMDANLIDPEEDEKISLERIAARQAVKLLDLGYAIQTGLKDENGGQEALAQLKTASEIDLRLKPLLVRLEGAVAEIDDISLEVKKWRERVEGDPKRLEEIEERADVLQTIKRKYGGSLEKAMAERERLEKGLIQMENMIDALSDSAKQVETARTILNIATDALSKKRAKMAKTLGIDVEKEFTSLRLEGARFEVVLRDLPEPTARGREEVELMFSANPKEPMQALNRVASGGELSRVMLALKSVRTTEEDQVTLIFDEVDAGIGGETALQIGLRLKRLAQTRQVLVVTHLPQIAAFADHHLIVEKKEGQDGRMQVFVRELLTSEERAGELARLMGGTVTTKALARAHELLLETRSMARPKLKVVGE